MAFSLSTIQGKEAAEDRIELKRSEKAKAFREYVDAKVALGEQIDPYELDSMRTSMAGGDPFLASYIPAGDALREMTSRANEKSRLKKLEINAGMAEQRSLERNYVQKIVDENWDKDEKKMAEIFDAAFGPDGARIYDQYKPELGSMLSEATNKKYSTLAQNPAAKMVRSEEDLYKFFPAEMRNPQTAAILKSMARDNMRQRSIDDVGNIGTILKNTPDFVMQDPAMQDWWSDFAGQSIPGSSDFLKKGISQMSTQVASEQQAKIIDMASKDPYFAQAAQSGDEDSIFTSIRSLMVQAGMPAPQSPADPRYLAVKKELDIISKTSAITMYNKREADLRAAALEEAQALTKGATARMEALASAYFPKSEYGNGKSGKNLAVDERISVALNLISTDANFFPSEENMQAAIQFIKNEFDADAENFDPAAAGMKFLSEGGADTKTEWIDRRAQSILEVEHGIKPGTNFTSWSTQRQTTLRQTMLDVFDALSQPTATEQEYNSILENKAIVVQALRNELSNIRTVVNTLNNDPSKRSNITNYDYNSSIQMMQSLENSLRLIESYNPVKPQQTSSETTPEPTTGYSEYSSPVIYDSVSSDYREPSNVSSGLDTYLDVIADIESGGDPFARAQTSSATGLLQFTKGTWNEMVKRYGQAHGITEEDIYNPNAQRIMGAYLTMENGRQLINQTGKKPTEKDLYLAHFLGPSRAAVVINNQGSQLLAANLFPDAAKANRNIFYKDGVPVTVEELYNRLGSKVARRMNTTA